MAGTDRSPRDAVDLLAEMQAEPYRFSLFSALRRLECAHADRPRMGAFGTRLSDEPVRLGQEPSLAFPPSMLATVQPGGGEGGGAPSIRVHGPGLFGPNGALPLHITEFVMDRQRFNGDDTIARFADIFHHRLLTLFYRAWADCEPTVSHDRPDSDPFAGYVASLIGLGTGGLRGRDAVPDLFKLHFAGRLVGQSRNPDGLAELIAGLLGLAVTIREFVCSWLDLSPDIRWRLGGASIGRLGEGLPVGARVRDAQHRFRIVLGPMPLDDYRAMLPDGPRLGPLAALVRGYVGDEFAWDVQLVLEAGAVPPFRLGGDSRLGWTTWLGPRRGGADADDLILTPDSSSDFNAGAL